MKRLVVIVAATVLAAGATTAWANNVSGTIKSVDPKNHELTLDDGKTYEVAGNVTLEGLQPGDKVKVNAEMKNGKSMVDKIEQTSTAAMNGSVSSGGGASTLTPAAPAPAAPN